MCETKGTYFDNYFNSYHSGIHCPGGDYRDLDIGYLTGGTFSGDRHFEELNFLTHHFDMKTAVLGETIFESTINNCGIPKITHSNKIDVFYNDLISYFDLNMPSKIIMVGNGKKYNLPGIETYIYPEIINQKAIAVPETISEQELKNLCNDSTEILCYFISEKTIKNLTEKDYRLKIEDNLSAEDDYLNVTYKYAKKWEKKADGWIVGDPILISHWIPTACHENLLALYSTPQEKIIKKMGDVIATKGSFIYGRQYHDKDFFELSKKQLPLQVIDPCRPPFQSVKHISYQWNTDTNQNGFFEPEYTDGELLQFAKEGKILISPVFWSGMIRELSNLYNLMDLIAITKLKCGIVLTAQSFEYMMHPPLEMMTLPLERGGVFPCVEPLLGSCGIGVGIESFIEPEKIENSIKEAFKRIFNKVKNDSYMPKGWWTTMDADMRALSFKKGPKPIKFMKYPPYVCIRFYDKARDEIAVSDNSNPGFIKKQIEQITNKIKQRIKQTHLIKFFESYRPYEFFEASELKHSIVNAAKNSGMQYMFTKSGFKDKPKAMYMDDSFIAMNYTCGQWDGWTPFETVNDVSDLIESEKKLLKTKRPGWIVSTIDTCLWAFSGEVWKRGSSLFDIADFCSNGGKSGRLINVKPYTISRYSRIIEESGIANHWEK